MRAWSTWYRPRSAATRFRVKVTLRSRSPGFWSQRKIGEPPSSLDRDLCAGERYERVELIRLLRVRSARRPVEVDEERGRRRAVVTVGHVQPVDAVLRSVAANEDLIALRAERRVARHTRPFVAERV